MNTRRQSDPRRRVAVGAAVAVLCLLAAACGSSSSTSSTGGGSATTTELAQGCPFSGQTTPASGTAKTEVASSLTKVATRKDDCIDNVQFDFSPDVPAWTVSYQTGPFTSPSGQQAPPAGAAFLVVQFQGVSATYAGPSSISGSGLNYVTGVTEVSSGTTGTDEWVITLNQKLQFTTSVSGTPAYLVVALG